MSDPLGPADLQAAQALRASMPSKLAEWAPKAPATFPDGYPTYAAEHLASLSNLVEWTCIDARTTDDLNVAIGLLKCMARLTDLPNVLPTLEENSETGFIRERLAAARPGQLEQFNAANAVLTRWWTVTGTQDEFIAKLVDADTPEDVMAVNARQTPPQP